MAAFVTPEMSSTHEFFNVMIAHCGYILADISVKDSLLGKNTSCLYCMTGDLYSKLKVSSEDASYTELVPMSSGAGDEVKAGLRNAIKTRRVAQGLDGMPLIEAKKPRLEVLSKEEEEKRRIRRERNKVAAFKCRQRRKEHIQKLQDESDELNSERSCLEKELVALKAQKEQLERMFQSHNCILKNKTASEDQVSEAKSPHSCSVEMAKSNEPSSPTSPVPDSITA
ncbi:proto-oncogene c-Fos-like isoform X2 [Stylophora pistillata]|uniref:proto-oncogene c-Fos-like isoform X2 n=2 Tax=Stylophora pistillata TaxID=50429 RepID=UPI000C044082|nr:proto-oncogene c-Fos-like isoform X2 [Stylophora pistillata]